MPYMAYLPYYGMVCTHIAHMPYVYPYVVVCTLCPFQGICRPGRTVTHLLPKKGEVWRLAPCG